MTNQLLFTLLFGLLGLWGGPTLAQNNGDLPEEWTLKACIDHALKNNIQVRQNEIEVLSSQISLRQAKYNRVPNITANTSFTNNVGRNIDPVTNDIFDTELNSNNLGVNSNVMLFNYFSLNNQIKKGKKDLELSEYNLESEKNNTTLNIINFYTSILLAKEQVNNAELTVESTKLQRERTQKRVDAGALPRQDLLQDEQQLANDELSLVQAENDLELAKLRLAQALQLPAGEDIAIVDPGLEDPEIVNLEQSSEEIYAIAEETQPSVKSADAAVESAQIDVQISKASLWPSINLGGGYSSNYSDIQEDVFGPYFDQLDLNLNRFVAISMDIPIFNRFNGRTRVSNSVLSLDRARLNALEARNTMRQNIEQAYLDVKLAARSYLANKKQVAALEESFRNVQQRRLLGAADPVEFNQTKNDLDIARSNLIRTKYDYIFKLKILDFYQNKPLDF